MILSKKACFMTAKLIFVGENKQLLTTHLSWIRLRLSKQIKQDTIWQKLCQKHEKRECTCVRTHEGWHPHPIRSCTHFGWFAPFSQQLRTYFIDDPFLNRKTYKDIRIHLNINIWKKKFLYEKINGSVGSKKHSDEKH